MMDCEIVSVGKDIGLLEECLDVRCAVFQREKGIPREIDVDEFDCICEECEHFLIRYDDKDVGTVRCRLDFERKEVRLQRFCICSDYRGFGFGRDMLEFLDVYYRDKGFEWIRLDSKFAVHGFYEKSGYRVVSDVFMEAGVEHVKMEKRISCFRDVPMSFSDMVQGENGLLVELRCNNVFNEQIFEDIKDYLEEHLPEWKENGFISVADAVSIFCLIDELSGGSRFWGEEVELRVEDASLELQDMLSTLED